MGGRLLSEIVMATEQTESSLVPVQLPQVVELQAFEQRLVTFINDHGLPSTNVFVSIPERGRVFSNVVHVIEKLAPERLAGPVAGSLGQIGLPLRPELHATFEAETRWKQNSGIEE
jgi:hypothetical protein